MFFYPKNGIMIRFIESHFMATAHSLNDFISEAQHSTLLQENLRQKVLQNASRLSETQRQKIVLLLHQAEAKKTEILTHLDIKKRAVVKTYLQKIEQFFKRTLPAMMRGVEEKDKAKEEATLNALLSQLHNA